MSGKLNPKKYVYVLSLC